MGKHFQADLDIFRFDFMLNEPHDVPPGKHFQADLDIFRFDFMLNEPHDVPPKFCFKMQTEMRFLFQQHLTPNFLQLLPSGEMS